MKPRLPVVVLELTARCNLSCAHCYNHWRRPGEAEPERGGYTQAMRTLKRLFKIADVGQVAFSGGEPLVEPRAAELALFCRRKGKGVAVITNGTVGDRARYLDFIRLGVRLFEIPVHSSTPARHDLMVGMAGAWGKSIASLKTLQELEADPVPVVVLTARNIGGVPDTLRLLAGMGLRRVMLNRVNLGGRAFADPGAVMPARADLDAAFRAANALAGELDLSLSANVCTPHCLVDPRDYPALRFGNCGQGALDRMPITLTADGDLRLCNHSPVVAGNIHRDSLESIAGSPYLRDWAATPVECAACARWSACRGGCRAASEQAGTGLGHADPALPVPVPVMAP